jgi:hypothetical protein
MKTKQSFVKRLVFPAVVAMLAIFSTAQAQEQQTSSESAPSTKFGIKGGLNLTNLHSDNFSDSHLKTGFLAGVYSKIPVTPGFSIQPELLYSLKGSKSDYNNPIQGNGEYRFNLGYVELPLLAVVNLSKNFSIHAGGYGAYLTNANIKNENSQNVQEGITDLNAEDFNRWDFGLAGGVGFDIENFTLGARYNYGFINIGKSGTASGNLLGNAKNYGLSFYVGFGF